MIWKVRRVHMYSTIEHEALGHRFASHFTRDSMLNVQCEFREKIVFEVLYFSHNAYEQFIVFVHYCTRCADKIWDPSNVFFLYCWLYIGYWFYNFLDRIFFLFSLMCTIFINILFYQICHYYFNFNFLKNIWETLIEILKI